MGKRGYLAYIIVVLLDLYLADFFSRVYVPDRQLFLDTDSQCSGTVNLSHLCLIDYNVSRGEKHMTRISDEKLFVRTFRTDARLIMRIVLKLQQNGLCRFRVFLRLVQSGTPTLV